MEEQITQILINHTTGCDDGFGGLNRGVMDDSIEDTSKDIVAHITEFIDWMNHGCETNDNGKWYVYGVDNEDERFKTSKELYNYWLIKE